MVRRFYIIFLIFSFFFFNNSRSQTSFKFEHLDINSGLSSNTITVIIQDKEGFLWIGTEEGLNRYDGFSFKVYKHKIGDDNSLSHNYIWSLCEDKEGKIWIATDGGG